MKTNNLIKSIICTALLALSFGSSAAFIDGAITMSGDFEPTGGTGLADATGIDFIDDDFDVDGATGDFAAAGITQGDIGIYSDFTFAPLASGTQVWSIGGFDFALDSIQVVFQSSFFIVLQGSGIISGNGFENTVGNWNLTGNVSGALFNFSSGTAAVSEPGTLAILGLGLVGLAVVRRRIK